MQLIPENHGKNYRIERMAVAAIKNLSKGKKGDFKKLRSIIWDEFPEHHMEDPPEELFTENVLFHGGNYTVLPGINPYCTDIFNYLVSAIYNTKNKLTKAFQGEVYHGVFLLLNLGAKLCEAAGLERNMFSENDGPALEHPGSVLQLGFKKEKYLEWCAAEKIPPKTIDYFSILPDDPGLETDDPFSCPLLAKPFVLFEETYYLALPTAQMQAINHYIVSVAKRHKVQEQVQTLLHERIWHEIWRACDYMNWMMTDIPLPELTEDVLVREALLQFDGAMLAYVCYLHPSELSSSHELHQAQEPVPFGKDSVNARMERVITELKSRKELEGYQFLTVLLLNGMGGFVAQSVHRPQEGEKRIWFNVFDFMTLANSGEWDHLDLWKYAKVYEAASLECQIIATSPLDAYAIYKRNGETFYLSDKRRPDLMTIVTGEGADLTREAKIKMDRHGALGSMDGSNVYVPVKCLRDYAPIYRPQSFNIPYKMYLGGYPFPVWVQNLQASDENQTGWVEILADAICFWLDRMGTVLKPHMEAMNVQLLNLTLVFEDDYFEPLPLELVDESMPMDFELHCTYNEQELTLEFPSHFERIFVGGDNRGERRVMNEILKCLNTLPGIVFSEAFITETLDEYIPLGKAKMMLFLDTRTDLQMDDRWLIPKLYVSEAEVNLLLDKLTSIIGNLDPIPESFVNNLEKKQFCNTAVLGLTKLLMEKIAVFDHSALLERLMELNERLIRNREFDKIQTTAQIFCFGHDEEKLQKILQNERGLVNTSISTRCLIEFLVNHPAKGTHRPSYDDLDELLAIMNEILNFGMLSDAIHFGMAAPEMGLLPSGRIGISKEFYDDKLLPFRRDNTRANIESQLEYFSNHFDTYRPAGEDPEYKEYYDVVDKAFLEDWGIEFANLIGICFQATSFAEKRESSVISMLEKELVAELHKVMPMAGEQLERGLVKLSLMEDTRAINVEKGYSDKEHFPWKYNREFSYARRPFIIVDTEEGRRYYWGMRNCISASRFLNHLLGSGRLNHGGPKIESLLGEIRERNGKNFRNAVATWLADNTALKVWEHEVTLKPNGHLAADKDYGDCDVLAYDSHNNVVCNLECKQTSAARNIHQMKLEMDAYLGREGQKKKMAKHVERDIWMQENLEVVQAFVDAKNVPTVKSLVVTSELIPTRYLRADDIELPIISYQELRSQGMALLQNAG